MEYDREHHGMPRLWDMLWVDLVLHGTAPYHFPRHTTTHLPRHTTQYCTICCAVLCCAVPCRAVPCCAVLCCAVLWYSLSPLRLGMFGSDVVK